jgi:hypothetical protein
MRNRRFGALTNPSHSHLSFQRLPFHTEALKDMNSNYRLGLIDMHPFSSWNTKRMLILAENWGQLK